MESWAAIPPEQIEQAQRSAAMPDGLMDWALWLLKQLVTVNVAWALIALFVGLIFAVGATEMSKRFEKLYRGENWALKAQLVAAVWGAFVTTGLIWVLTDWPVHGRLIACMSIAPLAAFYAHRFYDVLRRLFPVFMERASRKLRGEHNVDSSPP
jgi:predicted anti-sigma-YlaC factor YlaD